MAALAGGRSLELLGESPFARVIDRSIHLHDFNGDLDEQVARMAPATRAVVDAYCAGFDVGAGARGWPLALRVLGLKPAPYRPRDLVLAYRMVSWFGITSLHESAELVIAELAAKGASRSALSLLLGDSVSPEELAAWPRVVWPEALTSLGGGPLHGSNAIAISAKHSRTGSALSLGEPHLEIGRSPPVFYAMHADYADGTYEQGFGVPGMAFTSYGRTDHVSCGFTTAHSDVIDMMAVRCRRGEAWDGKTWQPLRRRVVKVRVKKRATEEWVYFDGPMGTLLGADSADEVLLPAIRWCGLRETWRDFDAFTEMWKARNVDEAVAAARGVCTIPLNTVFADSSGRVATVVVGRVDQAQPPWQGVAPRPPDGPPRPLDEAERPVSIDPPEGFVVSANNRWTSARWIPLPEPRYRHERLRELVAAGPVDLQGLGRMVGDGTDAASRRFLPIWAPHLPDEPRARELVAWAAAQPGSGDAHFRHMALAQALHHEVTVAAVRHHLGDLTDNLLSIGELVVFLFQHHLDNALALERPDVLDEATLARLLAVAWPRTLARAAQPEHQLPVRERFLNVLFQGKLPGFLGFDSKPITLPGGPTTPFQVTVTSMFGQRVVYGPAGRYLADMGKRGGQYAMPGGASERRFGPGYAAGLAAWAEGKFISMGPAT
jgi:penicillin amidase